MKQYHEDGNLWQYMIEDISCYCGCNVFHHEYNKQANKVLILCNACDYKIGELEDEYTEEELKKGLVQ